MYSERPAPPVPDARDAARSLAVGVLELCALCEDLLHLAASHDAAPAHMEALTEQLEAVRACAAPLAALPPAGSSRDPYSLSTLGQWVWHE